MLRLLLSTLLLALLPCTCALAQRMLPAAAVPGMIDTLHAEISKFHPTGFDQAGLSALEAAHTQVQRDVEQAIAGQDSLAIFDFYRLAQPIKEVTGCGHLYLEIFYDSTAYKAIKENNFPLPLVRVPDGRYLLKDTVTTTTTTLRAATEITHLNGQPIPELVNAFQYFAPYTDANSTDAMRANLARSLSYFYQQFYGVQDSLSLTVRSQEGEVEKQIIYPVSRAYINKKKNKTDIAETLRFQLSEDGQTGMLHIRKFSDFKFTNGNYFKFISRVFDSLRIAGIDELIIDLRDNGGGSSNRISYLYSFLSQTPFQFAAKLEMTGPAKAVAGEKTKITRLRSNGAVTKKERRIQKAGTKLQKMRKVNKRYNGKVVVLINEGTFSASGMFARYVQGSGRGKLVGTPTGAGSEVTFGGRESDPIYLGPQRDLELHVNTIRLTLPYATAGVVTPDVIVPITETALREGKDEQLAKAKAVLRGEE